MLGKSPFVDALEKWVKYGGDLREGLPSHGEYAVKSKAEANAICAALDAIRAGTSRAGEGLLGSPLDVLASFFQQVESKEAFAVLKQEGLPHLRKYVQDRLEGKKVEDDDVMFILKILAMYRQSDDVALIAEAARKPINEDGYMWSIIFRQFDVEHPFSAVMVDQLRDPLPTGFIGVAYLDMANGLAIEGQLDRHPFDSETGREHLEAWLRDANEENFSFAHSATAALPFIEGESLLQAAEAHPDALVRMEAAWARAKSGDSSGLERLSELCLNLSYSHTAQRYLEELGHSDKIPERAQQPNFRAVAKMADWLAHPMEFGRPADNLELYDTRELFWPPTNDQRQLWLVKYAYNGDEDGESDCGIGMVGSVTFALFGETTADLSPEDAYGLHCCWELERNEDPRAPKKRSAKAGREILARRNAGF